MRVVAAGSNGLGFQSWNFTFCHHRETELIRSTDDILSFDLFDIFSDTVNFMLFVVFSLQKDRWTNKQKLVILQLKTILFKAGWWKNGQITENNCS